MPSADEMLDQLVSDSPWPKAPTQPVLKLNYSHDAMIDQVIANPGISQNQLALIFGYTPAWISTVMSSDLFQARLAERRKELVDPVVLETVQNQFEGLVRRSLEVLQHKLNKDPDQIPDQLALRAFEVSVRAAGYGAKPDVVINHNEVHQTIESHGDQLVALLRRKKAEVLTLEVNPNDPSQDQAS
jgi:hypothetical protein